MFFKQVPAVALFNLDFIAECGPRENLNIINVVHVNPVLSRIIFLKVTTYYGKIILDIIQQKTFEFWVLVYWNPGFDANQFCICSPVLCFFVWSSLYTGGKIRFRNTSGSYFNCHEIVIFFCPVKNKYVYMLSTLHSDHNSRSTTVWYMYNIRCCVFRVWKLRFIILVSHTPKIPSETLLLFVSLNSWTDCFHKR